MFYIISNVYKSVMQYHNISGRFESWTWTRASRTVNLIVGNFNPRSCQKIMIEKYFSYFLVDKISKILINR